MEHLKTLNTILEPDERQYFFRTVDPETRAPNPLTLNHLHNEAASIILDDTVPEKIRSHFSTALNLLVYSWFHYPFNVTAQFLAYVTVEMALKEKYQLKKHSFSRLIKRAVEDGSIKSEGFSHIRNQQEKSMLGVDLSSLETTDYCYILIDTMPYLRNELAHGSNMLHPNGATSVRICAELINQLFKTTE